MVGFIGSFYDYEGLDDLIAAMPLLVERRPKAQLLLVGGGPMEAALKAQADGVAGVADRIRFVGRVPHEEVERYYALIDMLAYPRKAMRLTELVTPLKPLEAMAQRKLVVASDVGGHRELIEDGVTGTLFPAGDPAALADGAGRPVRPARPMGGAARHRPRASSSASVTGRQTFRVMLPSTNGLRARLHDRIRGLSEAFARRRPQRARRAGGGAGRLSPSRSSPSPCPADVLADLVGASGLPSLLRGRPAAARLQGADRHRRGRRDRRVRRGLPDAALARPAGTRRSGEAEETDPDAAPRLRRRDFHPDAPPRPPIMAADELGEPEDRRLPPSTRRCRAC